MYGPDNIFILNIIFLKSAKITDSIQQFHFSAYTLILVQKHICTSLFPAMLSAIARI